MTHVPAPGLASAAPLKELTVCVERTKLETVLQTERERIALARRPRPGTSASLIGVLTLGCSIPTCPVVAVRVHVDEATTRHDDPRLPGLTAITKVPGELTCPACRAPLDFAGYVPGRR